MNLLLLDAGTGVRRLATDWGLMEGVEEIDVVLSHFHLDHVIGLYYLKSLGEGLTIRVWGPGAWLYKSSTRAMVDHLLGEPWGAPHTPDAIATVEEVGPNTGDIGGFRVNVRHQARHSHPSLAIRVEGRLAYCTDTAADPATVEFVHGSQLLIHDSWHLGEHGDDTHASAAEAARIAAEAGVGALLLFHIDPRRDPEGRVPRVAEERFSRVQVAQDGQSYNL